MREILGKVNEAIALQAQRIVASDSVPLITMDSNHAKSSTPTALFWWEWISEHQRQTFKMCCWSCVIKLCFSFSWSVSLNLRRINMGERSNTFYYFSICYHCNWNLFGRVDRQYQLCIYPFHANNEIKKGYINPYHIESIEQISIFKPVPVHNLRCYIEYVVFTYMMKNTSVHHQLSKFHCFLSVCKLEFFNQPINCFCAFYNKFLFCVLVYVAYKALFIFLEVISSVHHLHSSIRIRYFLYEKIDLSSHSKEIKLLKKK